MKPLGGRLQHRARKRFGQNFLHDPRVVERIVAAIDPRPGQAIVEIGPGQAALTRALITRAGSITAIETVHRLWIGSSAESMRLVTEFIGQEVDFAVLTFTPAPPLVNIR